MFMFGKLYITAAVWSSPEGAENGMENSKLHLMLEQQLLMDQLNP